MMVAGPSLPGVTPQTVCAVNGANVEANTALIVVAPSMADAIRRRDWPTASEIVAALGVVVMFFATTALEVLL